MTRDELNKELKEINKALNQLISFIKNQGDYKEFSMAITHFESALLWLAKGIEIKLITEGKLHETTISNNQ